jgi:serine/threonine protein kinase
MAPEIIENEDGNPIDLSIKSPMPYEESADLWSLGIITYELLVGTTPFYDPNLTITKKRILSCDYVLADNLHCDAQHLIRHLIKYNREERLKLENVFEHKFIQTFAQKNFLNETFHHFASIHQYQNNRK